MRKKILAALLLSVLMDIAACSGTQTCRVSGLTPGQTYMYGYEDGAGNTTIGGILGSKYNLRYSQRGFLG